MRRRPLLQIYRAGGIFAKWLFSLFQDNASCYANYYACEAAEIFPSCLPLFLCGVWHASVED